VIDHISTIKDGIYEINISVELQNMFRGGQLGGSPKWLLFCIQGATIHTPLHQIGINLVLN
jgi:hypothetical protein